jgi:septation ring formation regulator EzrA
MKKTIILLLVLTSLMSFAQQFDKRAERIKALRVAFISDKLELTSQEAEKFWPVFNKFSDAQRDNHKKKRQLMDKLKPENASNLSEAETSKLLNETETIDGELEDKKRQFVKDLQGIIPAKKILLLKKIEEDFKNTLLKQFKRRRKDLPGAKD